MAAAHVQNDRSWTTTDQDKTVTLTPAVGNLIFVVFGASGTTTVGTISDDKGGTYTTAISATFNDGSADHYIALAVRNALIDSASSTVFTFTRGVTTTGGGLNVMEFSGFTRSGTSAIVQTAQQNNGTAGNTPAPAFSSAVDTNNLTFGGVHNNSNVAGLTPPTSWVERQDVGYNSPVSGLETVTRASGFTGTTVTWGSTSATAFAAVMCELSIAAPPESLDEVVSEMSLTGVGR